MSRIKNKFNHKVEFFENNIWHEEKQIGREGDQLPWTRPFVDKQNLDNSLDNGSITLWCVYRKQPIKPFTPIRITIYEFDAEDNKIVKDEIYRFASSASIVQKAFTYNGVQKDLYTHTLPTLELTKLLERIGCETLSNTRYLGHDYIEGAQAADFEMVIESVTYASGGTGETTLSEEEQNIIKGQYSLYGTYISPIPVNSVISLIDFKVENFNNIINSLTILDKWTEVLDPNGNVLTTGSTYDQITEAPQSYRVRNFIRCNFTFLTVRKIAIIYFEYKIEVFESRPKRLFKSITEAINRVLDVIPLRREGIEPRPFKLDPAWSERLDKIIAPEFFSPRKNLFETLALIVAKPHLIPRLAWDSETNTPSLITFDELGGNQERTIKERIAAYNCDINIDDYCDEIDCVAENIVNTLDKQQGSITEGFFTLRTDEGNIDIIDDNACFVTSRPIYQITKFTMGYIDNNRYVGDITPFVYEEAEYDALSENASIFPYSRSFALKYKQGDNKITGFAQKRQNTISDLLTLPVIQNIVEAKGFSLIGFPKYKDLAFKIEYIPIGSSRVIQRKAYIGDFPTGNTLIYNQAESTVEAQSFGEKMKGDLARMGNAIETITYKFEAYDDIPKVGELINGKYVASVACSYELDSITATIVLAENYNQIMAYLGIDSNYRAYDISEKQSYERHIAYAEDVIIGDEIENDDTASITSSGIERFTGIFKSTGGGLPVTAAVAQGASAGGIDNGFIKLPVVGQAFGNTICFQWSYKDNFSAGMQSVYLDANKNEQRAVQYTDVYGELYYLKLELQYGPITVIFSEQKSTEEHQGAGNMYPKTSGRPGSYVYFSYFDNPLIVQKDSREYLNVSTQLCLRSNRKSIVIGSALASRNPLVSTAKRNLKVYFFKKKLNSLNGFVEVEEEHFVTSDITIFNASLSDKKRFAIQGFTNDTEQEFAAWAIVNEVLDESGRFYTTELLLGENAPIRPGETTNDVYFTFTSNKNRRIV